MGKKIEVTAIIDLDKGKEMFLPMIMELMETFQTQPELVTAETIGNYAKQVGILVDFKIQEIPNIPLNIRSSTE